MKFLAAVLPNNKILAILNTVTSCHGTKCGPLIGLIKQGMQNQGINEVQWMHSWQKQDLIFGIQACTASNHLQIITSNMVSNAVHFLQFLRVRSNPSSWGHWPHMYPVLLSAHCSSGMSYWYRHPVRFPSLVQFWKTVGKTTVVKYVWLTEVSLKKPA